MRMRRARQVNLLLGVLAVCCFLSLGPPAPAPAAVPKEFWAPTLAGLATTGTTIAHKALDSYYSPQRVLFRELRRSYPPVRPPKRVAYNVDDIDRALRQRSGLTVIHGPHHCGKTLYVQTMLCDMADERSVRYDMVNGENEASDLVNELIFGGRTDFARRLLRTVLPGQVWPKTVYKWVKALQQVNERRKSMGKLPPVLVIDEVNALSTEVVEELVRFGKAASDVEAANVVLVTSPGRRSVDIVKASAMSRGDLIVMPDPPKEAMEEALSKMCIKLNKPNMSSADIDQLYDLTGGRWEDVDKVGVFLKRNKQFDFGLYEDFRFKAMGTKVARAAMEAKLDKNLVWSFLKRVTNETRVELATPNVRSDEYEIAMALVEVNLLKTVVSEAGAVEVEFHGKVVEEFMHHKTVAP